MHDGLKRMSSIITNKITISVLMWTMVLLDIILNRLANIYDSQMLLMLLDPEHINDCVWADSAYAGECFETLLNLGGFETCIHEQGGRNHPLSSAAKQRDRIKSAIRACVEHVLAV